MPWIERYVLLRGDKYAERQRDLSRGKLEHEIRMLWHKHARRSCPDPKNWLRHFDDDDDDKRYGILAAEEAKLAKAHAGGEDQNSR